MINLSATYISGHVRHALWVGCGGVAGGRRVWGVDWSAWHDEYDLPDSRLARRLQTVQAQIRVTLDARPAGPLRVVSMCAGQGRDILGVLADHPRRADVTARLVELDRRNAEVAQAAADAAGLDGVRIVEGDASLTDCYAGMVPADLVLACGIFGNISNADIERTIGACTQLCKRGGTVIWTRHRSEPDPVPLICDWFRGQGFELQFLTSRDTGFGVGAHRFRGEPAPLRADMRMFQFVGHDALHA